MHYRGRNVDDFASVQVPELEALHAPGLPEGTIHQNLAAKPAKQAWARDLSRNGELIARPSRGAFVEGSPAIPHPQDGVERKWPKRNTALEPRLVIPLPFPHRNHFSIDLQRINRDLHRQSCGYGHTPVTKLQDIHTRG